MEGTAKTDVNSRKGTTDKDRLIEKNHSYPSQHILKIFSPIAREGEKKN